MPAIYVLHSSGSDNFPWACNIDISTQGQAIALGLFACGSRSMSLRLFEVDSHIHTVSPLAFRFVVACRWIASAVRGMDSEAVQPRSKPKSMMAAKSFSITSSMAVIEKWIAILAEELAERMRHDMEQHKRTAKTLVLHHQYVVEVPPAVALFLMPSRYVAHSDLHSA